MFIQEFKCLCPCSGGTIEVKLPPEHRNGILDPRANSPREILFQCNYHDDGITVTLTRIDQSVLRDIDAFEMRVYDPNNEDVPKFDSIIYRYLGVDREVAPLETVVAIIDPSVKIIQEDAFMGCKKMKKCIMHNKLETIEEVAFWGCVSLDALFLPSSLKTIKCNAFYECRNMRILPLPPNIDIQQMGGEILQDCDTFFRITQIQEYHLNYDREAINNHSVHQAIQEFYRNLPPLHRVCLDTNVSAQTIHDCIVGRGSDVASIVDHDGMTPLHILAMNPHATPGAIQECFEANMCAAFERDSRGNTPLHYLEEHISIEGYIWLIRSLCMHRYSMMLE